MGSVYLKLQSHSSSDALTTNVVELLTTSVSISVSKTIPSFAVPLSGVATGESITAALDLGMSQKTISVQGIILDQVIRKTHTDGGDPISRVFTAHEVAQMIASGVDSTGFAKNQAFNELVVLMPSTVDKDYNQVAERQIPFTWKSRGGALKQDNSRVPLPFPFPHSETDDGLKGFIRSFGFSFNSENRFIDFTLEFQVALILP